MNIKLVGLLLFVGVTALDAEWNRWLQKLINSNPNNPDQLHRYASRVVVGVQREAAKLKDEDSLSKQIELAKDMIKLHHIIAMQRPHINEMYHSDFLAVYNKLMSRIDKEVGKYVPNTTSVTGQSDPLPEELKLHCLLFTNSENCVLRKKGHPSEKDYERFKGVIISGFRLLKTGSDVTATAKLIQDAAKVLALFRGKYMMFEKAISSVLAEKNGETYQLMQKLTDPVYVPPRMPSAPKKFPYDFLLHKYLVYEAFAMLVKKGKISTEELDQVKAKFKVYAGRAAADWHSRVLSGEDTDPTVRIKYALAALSGNEYGLEMGWLGEPVKNYPEGHEAVIGIVREALANRKPEDMVDSMRRALGMDEEISKKKLLDYWTN